MSAQSETVDFTTLKNILANLVTVPEEVKIDRQIDEKGVLLSVIVNSKDMGIVIGRGGVMANAIKTIMRAVGKANNMMVRVEFLEPDGSIKYSAERNFNSEGAQNISSSEIDEDLADFVIT